MIDLYNLRRDFTLKRLDKQDMLPSPFSMLEKWLNEAIAVEVLEPNTMTLSTATKDGKPSSRVVLLKEIKPCGLVFFTNYESRKGQQLAQNSYCALNFMWHELERQVRIEGCAEKIPGDESDRYFDARPAKSKLGAWASPQSKPISGRESLEEFITDFESKLGGKKIPRPANWGGYIVKPYLFEFWQGRSNRLHDRLQYSLSETNEWVIERLAP